jgi:integrase/recombinase XerD
MLDCRLGHFTVIESIFQSEKVWQRHFEAPLLQERERFLAYLIQEGCKLPQVKGIAQALLHIVSGMKLEVLRPTYRNEIRTAIERWRSSRSNCIRYARGCMPPNEYYSGIAFRWFRFHNLLLNSRSETNPYDEARRQFIDAMRERGLAPESVRGYGQRVSRFLVWCVKNQVSLSTIRLVDVDTYFEEKRTWQPVTVASVCQGLRAFFRFAEERGWCPPGLQRGILKPRVPKYTECPKGPPWSEVRRLLDFKPDKEPSNLRTHAMLCLCAVYALRRSEVRNLLIGDFDWVNETFFVRRAKGGRIQHYPIQYEVGEAILDYLRYGRPRCSCRHLFVSMTVPFRAMGFSAVGRAISKRATLLSVSGTRVGPHSLRHACATELLRKGSSLRDIADFLGHRDLKTVSVYARYDVRTLRRVADFSLGGLQ